MLLRRSLSPNNEPRPIWMNELLFQTFLSQFANDDQTKTLVTMSRNYDRVSGLRGRAYR